jgi:hypothetical protein
VTVDEPKALDECLLRRDPGDGDLPPEPPGRHGRRDRRRVPRPEDLDEPAARILAVGEHLVPLDVQRAAIADNLRELDGFCADVDADEALHGSSVAGARHMAPHLETSVAAANVTSAL